MDRYNFAYKTLTSIVKSATYKPWEVNSQKVMNIITPIYKQWKTIFKDHSVVSYSLRPHGL